MEKLCEQFGKTRQAYYEQLWQEEKTQMQDLLVIEEVEKIRKDLPKVGTQKLHYLLQDFFRKHQVKLGRDKLYDLLREHQLLPTMKRNRIRTTNSLHHYFKYPNLIKGLTFTLAHQLWVSDITYIALINGFCYLSLITDGYSRRIVGWALEESLQVKGPIKALEMAIKSLPKAPHTLIHHSDRGIQYCSHQYVKLLKNKGIRISMTNNGDPYENALAERVNRTIKEEFNCHGFFTFAAAQIAIEKAIRIYNQIRPHASCDYLTPEQAHQIQGPLKKRWKNRVSKSSIDV